MTLIDKIAWIRLADGKILSTADYSGTLAASSEIAELAWLSYADRDRVSPVDQIIFDHLHGGGELA
jgi:8-oxo-dGTP diphosphatase